MADASSASNGRQRGVLPYDSIDSGVIRQMKGCDAEIYSAISAHANWSTLKACPSLERLCWLTDRSPETVCEAIRRLEKIGAITKQKGGGRNNCNVYTLQAGWQPDENTQGCLSDSKPKTVKADKSKHSNLRLETLQSGTENTQAGQRGTCRTCLTLTEQKSAAVSEADEEDRAAIVELLAKRGIREPNQSRIADKYPLHVIQGILRGLDGNAPAGVCVNEINNQGPGLLKREEYLDAIRRVERKKLEGILSNCILAYDADSDAIEHVLASMSETDAPSVLPRIRETIIEQLGDTRAARDVVQEWYRKVVDPLKTAAGRCLAAPIWSDIQHEHKQRKQLTQSRNIRPKLIDGPDPKDKEFADGKRWFDELPDVNVIAYFRRMVEDEQTNKGFRERWANADLDAQQIRAEQNIRMGIIAMYGPRATEAKTEQ